MIQYIANQIRNTAIGNADIYAKIGTRFYPQEIDLTDNPTYPLVVFSFLGGFPDEDGYDSNSYMFDCAYISETSLDESIEIYELFHGIINRVAFTNATDTQYFQVVEDTKPLEASDEIGGKLLYIFSNTWTAKAVGK